MENVNKPKLLPFKIIIYNIISIICVVIATLARLYNPGWLLFIISFTGRIHIAVFIISNYNLSRFVNKSMLANLLFWLSCITFTMVYVLLPDFSDTSQYAICGLIQDSKILSILFIITKYSFRINIVLIILGLCISKIINMKETIIQKQEEYEEDKLNGNNKNLLEKDYKIIKNISIVIFVFCIISLILCSFNGTIYGVLSYSISSLLIGLTIIFANEKRIYGAISGIISAILLIFSPSILYNIGAIILMIFCIKTLYKKSLMKSIN